MDKDELERWRRDPVSIELLEFLRDKYAVDKWWHAATTWEAVQRLKGQKDVLNAIDSFLGGDHA